MRLNVEIKFDLQERNNKKEQKREKQIDKNIVQIHCVLSVVLKI
jgi:hypothetical protein